MKADVEKLEKDLGEREQELDAWLRELEDSVAQCASPPEPAEATTPPATETTADQEKVGKDLEEREKAMDAWVLGAAANAPGGLAEAMETTADQEKVGKDLEE